MKTIDCFMDGGYFLKKLGCLYSIVTPSGFDISFIYPHNADLKYLYKDTEKYPVTKRNEMIVSGRNNCSVLGTKATFCGRLSETGFDQFNI